MFGHKLARWVIITCAMILSTYALVQNGVLIRVLSMDTTFISLGILIAFIIAHFFVLKNITSYDEVLDKKLWYIAEALIAIGMIGTVVGFTMLFGEAFATLDVSNPESIADVLTDLAMGMGTALITTLTGLICSLILKGELVFLNGDEPDA